MNKSVLQYYKNLYWLKLFCGPAWPSGHCVALHCITMNINLFNLNLAELKLTAGCATTSPQWTRNKALQLSSKRLWVGYRNTMRISFH